MRILVTGSSGMLGRRVCARLAESGHTVTRVVRPSTPSVVGPCLALDLLDEGAAATLALQCPDAVVHCAARLPARIGAGDEGLAASENRRMDDAVLSACERVGCPLVYASSLSVYGSLPGPWREDGPIDPRGPYAAGKVETERRIAARIRSAAILRIGAPYGVGQRARTVVRVFLERALAGEDLLYHGDGSREQDFVSADGAAEALVLAALSNSPPGVVNIGGGRPVSMRELADMIVAVVPGCRSRVLPSGTSDPQANYRARLDISKASRVLGWKPRTTLEDGLKNWLRELAATA